MRETTGIITYLPRPILFKIIEYILVNPLPAFYLKLAVGVRVEEVFTFLYIIVLKRRFNWLHLAFVSLKRGLNEMSTNLIFYMLYVHLPTRNTRPNHRIIWKLKSVNSKRGKNTYMRIYKSTPIDNFFLIQTFMYKLFTSSYIFSLQCIHITYSLHLRFRI